MEVYAFVLAVSTLWSMAGALSVLWIRGRGPLARARRGGLGRGSPGREPVSVLKPLRGCDPDLESNLRTLFEQSHPNYEIVFGVEGQDDPALPVVRRLQREYPEVASQVVVHRGRPGLNPKVRNLRAMLEVARHDVLLISDSNVRAAPGYLRQMVRELSRPGTGLVTNLVAGVGERSLGARVDTGLLNGPLATGVAAGSVCFGQPVVVGKSMMFRRSVVQRLGGLGAVADVLAEDHLLGRMFHEAGLTVRMARAPVFAVSGSMGIGAALERQIRWSMIRLRLVPGLFLLEPLAFPFAVAALAPAFGVAWPWAVAWAAALTAMRDAVQWVALRGPSGLPWALACFPVRETLALAAWAVAPFRRHVRWRGRRVRVYDGTRLRADRGGYLPEAVSADPCGVSAS